jgi:hypothetical protein
MAVFIDHLDREIQAIWATSLRPITGSESPIARKLANAPAIYL